MKRKELSVLLYQGLVQGLVSFGLGETGNGFVCKIGQYEFRPDQPLIEAGTDFAVAASLADSIRSMEESDPYLYGYFIKIPPGKPMGLAPWEEPAEYVFQP